MASKQHILTLLALFSSWFFVGFSQTTSDAFRLASSGGAESFPCLQNLVHCQPYLKGSSNPTATCCEQLNETVTYDLKCLCDLLSNTDVLKSYNISSEEVNKLPKECGIDTKKSSCKGFSDLLLLFSFSFFGSP